MIAALMNNMRVGIERDISDRIIITEQERAFGEVTVHQVENSLTIAAALKERRIGRITPKMSRPMTHCRYVRFVTVLLGKQPLHHPRLGLEFLRQVQHSVSQIIEDRIRSRQHKIPVDQTFYPAVRVEREEGGRSHITCHDIEPLDPEQLAQLPEEQPDPVPLPERWLS